MNGLYPVCPGHAADLRPDVFPKALQAQTRGAKPPSYPPHVPFLFPSAANCAVDVQLYGYRWINLKKRPDRPVGRWYKNESVTWSALLCGRECIVFFR